MTIQYYNFPTLKCNHVIYFAKVTACFLGGKGRYIKLKHICSMARVLKMCYGSKTACVSLKSIGLSPFQHPHFLGMQACNCLSINACVFTIYSGMALGMLSNKCYRPINILYCLIQSAKLKTVQQASAAL